MISREEIARKIGSKINFYRKSNQLTLLELSKKVDLSEGMVSRYESGEIKTIGIDTLIKFADALGCSPSDLMDWNLSDSSYPEDVKFLLKSRRLELGLTLKEVAKAVGVSEGTVSKWESGNIANMKRNRIASLAKILNISPSLIMGWDTDDTDIFALSTDDKKIFLEKFRKLSHDDQMLLFGIMDSFIDRRNSVSLPATGTK